MEGEEGREREEEMRGGDRKRRAFPPFKPYLK